VRRLRAAGIEVIHGLMAEASRELNIGFFSRMLRARPWVRMKVAGSLDGRSALPDGRSQWITGAAARADGHAWRRRAGAILTGVGTVLDDDPRLDTRLATDPWGRLPLRVVLDSTLRTPPHLFDNSYTQMMAGSKQPALISLPLVSAVGKLQ